MPMKRKPQKQLINKTSIVDLILTKYRIDPDTLRKCLPEVTHALDKVYPSRQSPLSPFGLTSHERAHRIEALGDIIERLNSGQVNRQGAVKALEHCSVLIEDDNLPTEVDRRTLLRLLGIALDKPLSDITANTTVEISQDDTSAAINHIALVRGAILNLTQDMHLVSISVFPQKVKETPKAMRLIAMSKNREDKHATP